MSKRVRAVDKSVRDHSQAAIIVNDVITIESYVGRQKVGITCTIPLEEWRETAKFGNPFYAEFELIGKKTRNLDDQPGGPEQAQRIRDSMNYAIRKALKEYDAN